MLGEWHCLVYTCVSSKGPCYVKAHPSRTGLATHEPHFTILREEFKPGQPRPCEICGQFGQWLCARTADTTIHVACTLFGNFFGNNRRAYNDRVNFLKRGMPNQSSNERPRADVSLSIPGSLSCCLDNWSGANLNSCIVLHI